MGKQSVVAQAHPESANDPKHEEANANCPPTKCAWNQGKGGDEMHRDNAKDVQSVPPLGSGARSNPTGFVDVVGIVGRHQCYAGAGECAQERSVEVIQHARGVGHDRRLRCTSGARCPGIAGFSGYICGCFGRLHRSLLRGLEQEYLDSLSSPILNFPAALCWAVARSERSNPCQCKQVSVRLPAARCTRP